MNNTIRNEMIVVLGNEKVCADCQIRVLSNISKFLDNVDYSNKIKESLDLIVSRDEENMNFWVELPKMISIIININKANVVGSTAIEVDYMKYVLYAVIYNYLETYHADILNKQNPGDLRICFLNILDILLTKPKNIQLNRETLFQMLSSCVCGPDGLIRL